MNVNTEDEMIEKLYKERDNLKNTLNKIKEYVESYNGLYLYDSDKIKNIIRMNTVKGWIDWKGGECPVDVRARVEVMFRNGCGRDDERQKIAINFRWSDCDGNRDIVKYRLVNSSNY